MDAMLGMCSVAFIFGAVIGILYACIFYGIPILYDICLMMFDAFRTTFNTCKTGFKEGWNRHSSEQQN